MNPTDPLGDMSLCKQRRDEMPAWGWIIFGIVLLALLACAAMAEIPASLVSYRRGADVVMYVTNGVPNVQYLIYDLSNTNDYWRRAYSISYNTNAEISLYTTNTPWRLGALYQIRGVLPDNP